MNKFSKTLGVLKSLEYNWISKRVEISLFELKLPFFFSEKEFEENHLKEEIEKVIVNFLSHKVEDIIPYTHFMCKNFKNQLHDNSLMNESDIWNFIYPSSIRIELELNKKVEYTGNYILSVTCDTEWDEVIGLDYRNGIDFIGVLEGWGNFSKFKKKKIEGDD